MLVILTETRECAKLWQDLSWYLWCGTITRALRTTTELDWYKNNHRFIYHFTSFIYPFVR